MTLQTREIPQSYQANRQIHTARRITCYSFDSADFTGKDLSHSRRFRTPAEQQSLASWCSPYASHWFWMVAMESRHQVKWKLRALLKRLAHTEAPCLAMRDAVWFVCYNGPRSLVPGRLPTLDKKPQFENKVSLSWIIRTKFESLWIRRLKSVEGKFPLFRSARVIGPMRTFDARDHHNGISRYVCFFPWWIFLILHENSTYSVVAV